MFIVDDEVIIGHRPYLELMRMIADPRIDVSTNEDFQALYKGYYFPAPISHEFLNLYFQYMQESRYQCPSFRAAIESIRDFSGQVHYSFTSKLLHTLNPQNPVLDKHIMRLLGFQLMDSNSGNYTERINYYCNVFDTVSNEYRNYANAPFMKEAIEHFNCLFPEYRNIDYSKKVDMLLFRLRGERSISILDYMFMGR